MIRMSAALSLLLLTIMSQNLQDSDAFAPNANVNLKRLSLQKTSTHSFGTYLYSSAEPGGEGDGDGKDADEEGMSLAADFSKMLQERNIQLDEGDFLDDDDEEDDDDDDDEDDDASATAVGSDSTSSTSTLSDDQVYRELDERVLETAGGFVDLLSGASEDDEDGDKPKVYESPKDVPDSSLTAGDVIMTVLAALNHNDVPSSDRGVEILFGYSSPGSAIAQAIDIEGMTPGEYALFLKEEYEYKILFNHDNAMIEKGDYSVDGKKAFFTARLQSVLDPSDLTNVNFILSTEGTDGEDEDSCWMIDSLLIRPEGMRRRRRR